MSEPTSPVPAEAELHAYADDQMPPGRRAEVAAWLAANPAAAGEILAWQAQNAAIRALAAGGEADPEADPVEDLRMIRRLRARASSRSWPRLAAAGAALLLLGVMLGALATRALDRPGAPSLAEASRDSYVVYASEIRHPVEVGADERQHLVAWLGKRLDAAIDAPDLSGLGLRLVGGRLVPFGGAPGAMLMYEDGAGGRVTCLIARLAQSGTGIRFASRDGVSTLAWSERDLGYALSGTADRTRLQAIADAIRVQG